MTTVFDAAGEGGAKACWVPMRRARADRFESASSAAIPSSFQRVAFRRPEKPDMYWSALRAAERPVISVVEIGYVRRSEVSWQRGFLWLPLSMADAAHVAAAVSGYSPS